MHRPRDSYLLINTSALPLPPRETRVNLRGTLQQVHGTPETKQNRKGGKKLMMQFIDHMIWISPKTQMLVRLDVQTEAKLRTGELTR